MTKQAILSYNRNNGEDKNVEEDPDIALDDINLLR